MNELIQNLTSQLGIKPEQAEAGVGMMVKLAKDKLETGDFSQLTDKIPGLLEMISKAPASDDNTTGFGGGLGGMLGAALGSMGGDSTQNLAELVTGFSKLGLNADTVIKFTPIVTQYLEEHGGEIAQKIMKKLF